MFSHRSMKPSLVVGVIAVVGTLAGVACGAAATPTPTPAPTVAPTSTPTATAASPTATPTAAPTKAPPLAATSSPVATSTPTVKPTVASPTATPTVLVATPTPTKAPLTPTPTSGPQPKRGGTFLALGSNYSTFDPHRGGGVAEIFANAKLYNNLVRDVDPTNVTQIGCDLCESYSFGADGKSITFKLRPNVKFHNGKVMDAEDVKYSLLKMIGQVDGVTALRSGPIKDYVDPKEPVTVVDPLTVRINLVRAADAPLSYLATGTGGIMPKDYPADKAAREPIGTGPFTLTEYIKGSHTVFKRNDGYFLPGQPYVDGIRAPIIEVAATSEAAFFTGKLDAIFSSASFTMQNRPLINKMAKSGQLVDLEIPYGGWMPIAFNMTHPVFSDARVRRAVHLAFDRDGMLQAAYDGRGIVKVLFVGEPWGRSEAEIRQLPGWRQPKDQDLAEAKRLMAEAGYADGVEVPQLVGSMTAFSEFLQAELKKIGIRTTLDKQERSVVLDRMAALNYVIAGDTFAPGTDHPDEAVMGYFTTGAPRNWFGYSNPRIDELAVQASSTLEPAKKKAVLRQIEDILLEEIPYAFTIDRFQEFVWYSYVKGVVVGLRHGTMLRFDTVWLNK